MTIVSWGLETKIVKLNSCSCALGWQSRRLSAQHGGKRKGGKPQLHQEDI
jgi:hypothetical protein